MNNGLKPFKCTKWEVFTGPIEKTALDWNPQGYRRRGRLNRMWRRTILSKPNCHMVNNYTILYPVHITIHNWLTFSTGAFSNMSVTRPVKLHQ